MKPVPLIISGAGDFSLRICITMQTGLLFSSGKDEDYETDEKAHTVHLAEHGVAKAEKFFGIENLGRS